MTTKTKQGRPRVRPAGSITTTVTLPPGVHRKARIEAARHGVSMNTFVVQVLAEAAKGWKP